MSSPSSSRKSSRSPLRPLLLVLLATSLRGTSVQATSATIATNQSTEKPDYLETGRQISGILNRFMDLGYDKRVRPNYGGPPVNVNVTMRILSISSVNEVMMDFTADFYFRQTWHDPRLAFKKLANIHTLYVGAEVSKKIWLPDTFFGNEKLAYFHEATTPNVFLRIDHSGEVYRSIRLTVTSSCPMKLQYFPMDRQRCTIEAESYGYNVKDIIYRWAHDMAVERDKDISLPQFDIVTTVQKYRLEELTSGTYSRLIAEIHFARRMGYYLIQIYVPSSLTVIISWVSFWLHRNASPARVQLGVTTVLTMTTLMSSTKSSLPKVSYVKSIDIFLGTCFVMVFAALIEYATVGYLGKRIAMRKSHLQKAQARAQARLFARLQAPSITDPKPMISVDQSSELSDHVPGCSLNVDGDLKPVAPERAHNCHWLANQMLLGQSQTLPNKAGIDGQWIVPCRCNNHLASRSPNHSPVEYIMADGSGIRCSRRGVEAATAAAAATFVNAHRRQRALEPSTDASLSSFAFQDATKIRQIHPHDTFFRVRPSDIDKYSRVVFPVCFLCFQLMYWLVYLHISTFFDDDTPPPLL